MAEQREHPLNRHLFIADNLNLLRALDNESIDLICIDPPFAKNQTFTGSLRPPLSDAERQQELETLAGWGIRSQRDADQAGIEWPDADNTGRFSDIWRWEDDVHEDWVTRIEGDFPALAKVIDSTRSAHSEGMAAYLTFMAIRIIEMRRALKPTGSMYLHCDPTASSYLGALMDSVFGAENFRSEITWKRTSSHNDARRNFSAIGDVILFYSKSDKFTFNRLFLPYSEEYIKNFYRYVDENNRRYRTDNLRSPHPRPNLTYDYKGYKPHPNGWSVSLERMKELDAEGRLHFPKKKSGRIQRKRFLDEMPGVPAGNIWDDIRPIGAQAKERTGYPTQKPVALAERIIKASSNPGDVALDCFAGCAYVPVAAERNGRQWIACDISPRALTALRRQFAKFNYAVDGTQQTETPLLNPDANIITRGPAELPERADEDPLERQDIKELPPRKFKVPASLIPEAEMLEQLLELSEYMAWCCGYANRMPDGRIIRTTRNFHLDHIDPKSKDGSNDIQNRAPLCPYHNTRKNNRRVHLADYRTEIADAGEMMVNTTGELINLAEAHHKAMQMYGQAYAARYGVGTED